MNCLAPFEPQRRNLSKVNHLSVAILVFYLQRVYSLHGFSVAEVEQWGILTSACEQPEYLGRVFVSRSEAQGRSLANKINDASQFVCVHMLHGWERVLLVIFLCSLNILSSSQQKADSTNQLLLNPSDKKYNKKNGHHELPAIFSFLSGGWGWGSSQLFESLQRYEGCFDLMSFLFPSQLPGEHGMSTDIHTGRILQ